MKIEHRHLCPACRVHRPTWEVKGAGKVKQDYRARGPIGLAKAPAELRDLLAAAPRAEAGVPADTAEITYISLNLVDRCEDCGQGMVSQLVVEYDPTGGTATLADVVDTLSRYTKVEHAVTAAKLQRTLDKARKEMSQ